MSGELKPCPCCGGSDLIRELATNDRVWVKCTSCTMMGWADDWNARADDWISVDDRLPDEGGRYWCYMVYCGSLAVHSYQWNCSWNEKEWGDMAKPSDKVTHWRPLPPPPETLK